MILKKLARGTQYVLPLARHIHRQTPFGFSFNLADRCPIGCQCYWRALERVPELTDEDVVRFFQTQKRNGMLLATIVGGEPYVRPKLLERISGLLPATWVVTSATTPLLHLQGTTHFISIDGADAQTHNAIRQSPGLYERVIKNLTKARSRGTFPVVIHSVLNAINHNQIEPILAAWRNSGLADGVIFSTATPIRGMGESLALTTEQRRGVAVGLLSAKEKFGTFLAMSPQMIGQLDPVVTAKQTPELCPTAQRVPSYDAAGNRISQCILGEKADCSACGCVITAMFEPFLRFDFATWRIIASLYTP